MESMTNNNLRELQLHFAGPDNSIEEVPLALVLECLHEYSTVIRSLSTYHRERECAHSAKRCAAPDSSYELGCRAVEPGSMNVVLELGPRPSDIHGTEHLTQVESFRHLVHETTELASRGALHELQHLISDNDCCRTVVNAFDKLGSLQGEWTLQILNAARHVIYDGSLRNSLLLVDSPVGTTPSAEELDGRLFAGRIRSIGVQSQILVLDLLSGGQLELPYSNFADLELKVDPETIVQVSGTLDGSISTVGGRLSKVDWIRAVDEAEIVITKFAMGGRAYRANPPLRFTVQFDPEGEFYDVSGDFGIHFAELTRDSIRLRLLEELEISWQDLAQEQDIAKLAPRATQIRSEMLQRIEECSSYA